jgi:threonylcarbamoyladenosine tRNA methylthiotransferase MtaB
MRPHIPERIAGERVARLSILAEENRQTYRDYWIGRTLPAIVETDSGANGTTVLTENYLPVVIPETGLRRGSRVMVRLTGLTHGVLDN